jgi:hypothetical protein
MILDDAANVQVEFGSGSQTLLILINEWCARVVKIYRDLDSSIEDHLVWGMDDLIGAFVLRDAVESGLQTLRATSPAGNVAALDVADELFKVFTREDSEGAVRRFDRAVIVGGGWWWSRIPKKGPIAMEISGSS